MWCQVAVRKMLTTAHWMQLHATFTREISHKHNIYKSHFMQSLHSKRSLNYDKISPLTINYSRLRWLHSTATLDVKFVKGEKINKGEETRLAKHGYFRNEEQNKENYIMSIDAYKLKEKLLRGHVEFIYSALGNMEKFGVHKDVEVYKKLMDVFPKVKMIPQTMWQEEFQHYPIQQDCGVDVLHQMEHWGVLPDSEMEFIILNIFGRNSHPMKKCLRMNYWMHKFNNASPWPLPKHVPNDALELAKLAVAQMCSVDQSSLITIFDTQEVKDSIDHTWIVSGQSVHQIELLEKQPDDIPLKVEGPTRIHLRDQVVNYFFLKADYRPLSEVKAVDRDDITEIIDLLNEDATLREGTAVTVKRSVHEQKDGTVLGICVTGTSSRDSLLSWVRLLGSTNPKLDAGLPVVFLQASPEETGDLAVTTNHADDQHKLHYRDEINYTTLENKSSSNKSAVDGDSYNTSDNSKHR